MKTYKETAKNHHMKDTVSTELWYCNRLEIKILKRHHYAVDFTEKNPEISKVLDKIRYWKKNLNQANIFVFVYMSSEFYLLCIFLIWTSGEKILKCWLEQYFIEKICYVLWKGHRENHCKKLLKEITFRHILIEWQQTLFRIKICEKAG